MTPRKRIASTAKVLEEAAEWHVLALLLSRPTLERRNEVRRLAGELSDQRLVAATHAWCDHAGEGAYLQLLGPGGLVPARAVAYRVFADPGWLLADIARYHEELGFHPALEEPPDHIAALAELVSYLLLKEVYARECDDGEAVAIIRGAREGFIAEHLTPVAARLAERLDAYGATEWSAAASLLAERVPAPPPAPATAPEPGEDGLQCGGCVGAAARAG